MEVAPIHMSADASVLDEPREEWIELCEELQEKVESAWQSFRRWFLPAQLVTALLYVSSAAYTVSGIADIARAQVFLVHFIAWAVSAVSVVAMVYNNTVYRVNYRSKPQFVQSVEAYMVGRSGLKGWQWSSKSPSLAARSIEGNSKTVDVTYSLYSDEFGLRVLEDASWRVGTARVARDLVHFAYEG